MKILATSDIHQMISKWKKLIDACDKEKPNVVAIAGDLFPKDTYITGQMPFLKHLKKYCQKIQEAGSDIVIILGNDDNQNLVPEFEKLDKEGFFHYIPEKVCEIGGYEFIGIPQVPDYPFGYKYWCHPEFKNAPRIDPQAFSPPLLVNENNKFEEIENFKEYFCNKKAIYDILNNMADKVKDIKKSIWLIHAPPSDMGLDICCHGAKVGSYAVLKFIEEKQPFICIHGHIHESPEYNGHKWCQHNGNTLCIQGGQIGYDLHYAILDIQDGQIVRKSHSAYY
jgi:Icc-related predicted phosphoesterase